MSEERQVIHEKWLDAGTDTDKEECSSEQRACPWQYSVSLSAGVVGNNTTLNKDRFRLVHYNNHNNLASYPNCRDRASSKMLAVGRDSHSHRDAEVEVDKPAAVAAVVVGIWARGGVELMM